MRASDPTGLASAGIGCCAGRATLHMLEITRKRHHSLQRIVPLIAEIPRQLRRNRTFTISLCALNIVSGMPNREDSGSDGIVTALPQDIDTENRPRTA
jgi:hypothetical protein